MNHIFNFLNSGKKRVKFNNIVDTILIPNKDEIIDQIDFDQLWYRRHEYKIMKQLFICELQVIACQQNINMRESRIRWSCNASIKEDEATSEQY